MAITLGTNISSLTSRNSLNSATDSLTTIYERLSSGIKINKAGDDAAGLVISQNMEAMIRGSEQAQANIESSMSFLEITEDAMISISDHFQRINDLLVNMANDTNDTDSRKAAVDEIIERLEEIDRLAESTNFNGKPMLDGTSGAIYVQLGADSSEQSYLDISDALTDCHVSAFLAELPDELNPYAYADQSGTVYIYDSSTGEYINYDDKDNPKTYTGDVTQLESTFDPSNANCRAYMETIQAAIDTITTNRGKIGAYENRLDSAYDALTSRIESLESAESVYVDTDIAEETTNMTSKQILQQINISLLAQINSQQSLALSLIGG